MMSEQVQSLPEKPFRQRRWVNGFILFSALSVLAGSIGCGAMMMTEADKRLVILEQQQNSRAHLNDIGRLQQAVKEKDADIEEQITQLRLALSALPTTFPESDVLKQQLNAMEALLKGQEARITVLSEQLQQLQQDKAKAPMSIVEKDTLTPPKTQNPTMSPKNRQSIQAPFVLTGIEKRGTTSFSAIAPRDFSQLSQIRLVGEGETISGWTLTGMGIGQAQFQVKGQRHILKVQ